MSINTSSKKVVIVGGVAGGAGVAARLRRNDENANIIILEKGPYISYANCGLPYYVGNVIKDQKDLLIQSIDGFSQRFNVDVRVENEVVQIQTSAKTVTVMYHAGGKTYEESYDVLVLSPGASPIRPRLPGADLQHVLTLRTVPDTVQIREFIETSHHHTAAIIGGGFIITDG